jgi:hypothetical protein
MDEQGLHDSLALAVCSPQRSASQSSGSTSVKSESDNITSEASQFSLNFEKFTSLEEACQCLQMAKDLACMENSLRKISQIRAANETLKCHMPSKDLSMLKRALAVSPLVLSILRLIDSEADREAVRQAVKCIEGRKKLNDQGGSISKEARQELFRAYKWLCDAYKGEVGDS